MQTEKYARKPFLIDAVKVTSENMEEVAKWCGGTIQTVQRGEHTVKYIQAPVSRPSNERQKKAFIGDYVLKAGKSFKCYEARAFDSCFEKPSEELLQKEMLPFKVLEKKYAPGQV